MGSGITQVFAQAGYQVFTGVNQKRLAKWCDFSPPNQLEPLK
jgi:3-hydroxyacyl-CoA dehydrogenase